tara:strand:+ start:343 stop:1833 length:1491 start_codon:yes stop_codon:yes gene_type:complete
MKNYFLTFIAGLIFPFGFAPFDIWPLTIISLSIFLYVLERRLSRNSFLLGFVYGLGLWSLGVSWVYVSIHYHGNQGILSSLLITILFIFFLSLYTGLTSYLIKKFRTSNKKLNYLIIFPVVWVTVEIIRSHLFTGFPWLIVGTSLAGTSMGGWIPILGVYGASILAVMISGSLVLIFGIKKKLDWSPALITVTILLSSFILNKINWTWEISNIQVSIYQPNLTLKEKWSSKGVRQTMSMISKSISDAQEGEFIFFPETAIIFDKEDLHTWISDIDKEAKARSISLISGIIAKDLQNPGLIERYNRIEGFGAVTGHYDKIHLVPFGEYIPLRNYLDKILDILGINLINTLPGESYSLLETNNIAISASICYEIAFSDLVRKTARKSNLLVTISNDTWFGASIGPEQHLEIAQSRAQEHQKSLIRATNSGISAIIDRKGDVLNRQGFFEDKKIKENVYIYEGNTPFSIVGNFLIYGYILLIYVYLFINKRTNVLFNKK